MSSVVSKTLMRDARKHLKSAMSEKLFVERTQIEVPALIVVMRLMPVQLHIPGSLKLRARKWRIIMPNFQDDIWEGTDVFTGERLRSDVRGDTYMVMEVTDPNSYNASTDVVSVITNATVHFRRGKKKTDSVQVYIARVGEEEKKYGVNFDWEVWWDSSVVFPADTPGGVLISKGDEMHWDRAPNPLPTNGNVTLDSPRYAYTETAVVAAYFKESL